VTSWHRQLRQSGSDPVGQRASCPLIIDHRRKLRKLSRAGRENGSSSDLSLLIHLPRRSLGEGGSFDVRCLLFGSCLPPIPSFAPCFNALTLQRFNAATM
jgi:hypothetical protein